MNKPRHRSADAITAPWSAFCASERERERQTTRQLVSVGFRRGWIVPPAAESALSDVQAHSSRYFMATPDIAPPVTKGKQPRAYKKRKKV